MFLADVDSDSVKFEDPKAVLDAMPLKVSMNSTERQHLLALLSTPQKRNSQLSCQDNIQVNGCGYINTDSAAYIYDEASQVITVFLNPKWQSLNNDSSKPLYFKPNADLKNAFVHRQTINYSGNSEYKNLSVTGIGALGVGESGYLGSAWRYIGEESPQLNTSNTYLDQLFYRYDMNDRYYMQAGRMDQRNLSSNLGGAFSFSLLPIGKTDGIRMGTTQAYLNQAAQNKGTPVNLILTAPSRVDVYRGNQLLSTNYVQGGLQDIDTAAYPDGSYILTMKVFENGQLARTETRPFSKSSAASGNVGDFQWFVQAGMAEDPTAQSFGPGQTQKSSSALVGGKLNTGFNTATTFGVAQVRNAHYAESKFDWSLPTRYGNLNTTADFFYGSDGSHGDTQQIYWNDGFSASLYRYNVGNTHCETDTYLSCYQSLNATVGTNVFGWSTTLGYSVSKTQNRQSELISYQDSTVSVNKTVNFYANEYGSSINRFANRSVQLSFSKTFVKDDWIFTPSVSLYRAQNNHLPDNGMTLTMSFSHRARITASGRTDFQSAQANVRQSKQQPAQENYQVSHVSNWTDNGYRELGATLSTTNNNERGVNINGRVETDMGRLSGAVSQYQAASQTRTDISGTYSSSFAVTPHQFIWGTDNGGADPMGGLLFEAPKQDASDEQPQAVADIQMPGATKVTLHAGEKIFAPVEGFQSVKSHVEDSTSRTGDGIATLDQGAGDLTWFMQPGKLGVRKLTATTQYTYLGQLMFNGTNALAGGLILNATVPNINDDGSFVAEFKGQPKELYVVKDKVIYQCPVRVMQNENGLRNLGSVSCKTTSVNDLPDKLRKLPRVVKVLKKTDLLAKY
ncbi:outermembrane fimbrial usher protein [Pseudomonas fluorescens BRIP34879]|nr:outermembrane fimbrial usher protein [Pseudomonas fluorescens BRIP34879]